MSRTGPSPGIAAPRTAVIMVNTNEGAFLERSLAALREQSVPPDRIVVVDNGSTDRSLEMLRERFPEVETIELGRNAGCAAANNAGVELVDDCQLVALLNADAFPEPGWLEALISAAREHRGHAAFGSLMLRANEAGLIDVAGDRYHVSGLAWQRNHLAPVETAPGADRNQEVFSACSGAALYRRDAYLEVGGLDEEFFVYWDDVDIGFRLRLAGYSTSYAPDAVVRHVGSGTTGAHSEFSVYHAQRNMVWTWMRDMPLPLLLLYLPSHVAINLIMVLTHARIGRGGTALRAKRDAVLGLRRILRERRDVQRRRRASSRQLRNAMATGLEITAGFPRLDRAAAVLKDRRRSTGGR